MLARFQGCNPHGIPGPRANSAVQARGPLQSDQRKPSAHELVKGLVEIGIWVVVILGPFLIPLALIIGLIVWLRRRKKTQSPPEKSPPSEPPPTTDS